eukprot:Platyproteum_vivax@DN3922_c0_g1_i2.p1
MANLCLCVVFLCVTVGLAHRLMNQTDFMVLVYQPEKKVFVISPAVLASAQSRLQLKRPVVNTLKVFYVPSLSQVFEEYGMYPVYFLSVADMKNLADALIKYALRKYRVCIGHSPPQKTYWIWEHSLCTKNMLSVSHAEQSYHYGHEVVLSMPGSSKPFLYLAHLPSLPSSCETFAEGCEEANDELRQVITTTLHTMTLNIEEAWDPTVFYGDKNSKATIVKLPKNLKLPPKPPSVAASKPKEELKQEQKQDQKEPQPGTPQAQKESKGNHPSNSYRLVMNLAVLVYLLQSLF